MSELPQAGSAFVTCMIVSAAENIEVGEMG